MQDDAYATSMYDWISGVDNTFADREPLEIWSQKVKKSSPTESLESGLHDIKNLDERGIPGCFVVTTAFREAAALQSKALGFEPAIAWVTHPIQNRTAAELKKLAQDSIEDILALLVS